MEDKKVKQIGNMHINTAALVKKAKAAGLNLSLNSKEQKNELLNIQDQYKKILENRKEDNGENITSVESAKKAFYDILNLDIESFFNISTKEYLVDYEKNEYLRSIFNEISWIDDEEICKAVFVNSDEENAFKELVGFCFGKMDLAKLRLDLLLSNLAVDINMDELSIGQIQQMKNLDENISDLCDFAIKIKTLAVKRDEQLALVRLYRNNLKAVAVNAIKKAYELNPNKREIDKSILEISELGAVTNAVSNAFINEYTKTDEDTAREEEHQVFREKIVEALGLVMHQESLVKNCLSEYTSASLKDILDGKNIHQIRSRYLEHVEEEYKQNPTRDNFEELLKASSIDVLDMVECPRGYFGDGTLATTLHSRLMYDLKNAKFKFIAKNLGMNEPSYDLIYIFKHVDDFNEVFDAYPDLNVDALYEASQLDIMEYDDREYLLEKMFKNIKLDDSLDEKMIRDIADVMDLETNTKVRRAEVLAQSKLLLKKMEEESLYLARYEDIFKAPSYARAVFGLKSVTPAQKKALVLAGHGNKDDDATVFDIILNLIAEFDVNLVSDFTTIDNHIENYDILYPYASLILGSDELFELIDIAISRGTYQIDGVVYEAIKKFARELTIKASQVINEFEFTMFAESLILNVEQIDMKQAQLLSTNHNIKLAAIGRGTYNSRIKGVSPSDKYLLDTSKYIRNLRTLSVDEILKQMKEESRLEVEMRYKQLYDESIKPEVKAAISKVVLYHATRLIYLGGLTEVNRFGSVSLMEKISPKKIEESITKLKPLVAKGLDKCDEDEFFVLLTQDNPSKAMSLVYSKMKEMLGE